MRKLALILALCAVTACAGTFQRGPVDPATGRPAPSPFEVGLDAAAKSYDESPWDSFGPMGVAIALALAGVEGTKAGTRVWAKRRRKNGEVPAE